MFKAEQIKRERDQLL